MTWPTDHPGRRCGTCGRCVYMFWADPDHPPPGTCPDGALRPKGCSSLKQHIVEREQLRLAMGRERSPEMTALMKAASVDEAWVATEIARWEAFNAAKTELMLGAVTVCGVSIAEWAGGPFSVERLAALLDHAQGQFDPWRGREPGDLTMLELGEEQARCEALSAAGWPEWEPE